MLKQITQSCLARKWQSQDLNPERLQKPQLYVGPGQMDVCESRAPGAPRGREKGKCCLVSLRKGSGTEQQPSGGIPPPGGGSTARWSVSGVIERRVKAQMASSGPSSKFHSFYPLSDSPHRLLLVHSSTHPPYAMCTGLKSLSPKSLLTHTL